MDFDVGRNDFDGDDPKNVRTRVDRTLLRIQDIRNGGVFMTSLKGRYQDFLRQYQRELSQERTIIMTKPQLSYLLPLVDDALKWLSSQLPAPPRQMTYDERLLRYFEKQSQIRTLTPQEQQQFGTLRRAFYPN